jgi:hypothetical protein
LWSTPVNPETQSAFFATPPAVAKEMASGSGSRVNKDPESLLRLGLPIKNKEVRNHTRSLIHSARSGLYVAFLTLSSRHFRKGAQVAGKFGRN